MLELTIGNPKTLSITLPDQGEPIDIQRCEYNFKTTLTDFSKDVFKNLLIERLSPFKNGNLCLSGGYDSQFMALLMKEAGFEFDTIIYKSLWDENVVNANDVAFSERFCNKHGFKFSVIEIDIKKYFEDTLMIPYVKEYRSASPQIIFHLYFLDQLNKNNYIMGGDIPWITYHERYKNPNTPFFSAPNLLQYYVIPYRIYNIKHNISMIKDIFLESPDLLFLSLKNHIEILKNQKVYIPTSDGIAYEKYRYKEIYYNSVLEIPLEHRLMCTTGFENLKKHYASITGQYDKFDKDYRQPLVDIKNKLYGQIISGSDQNRPIKTSIKLSDNGISPDSIMSEYMEVFDDVNPSPLKDYLFDF